MRPLSERILPELTLIDPGSQRVRMLQRAVNNPRTGVTAFLSVILATALFVLWDKLVASVSPGWGLLMMLLLYIIIFGAVLWFMRQDIRRRLRAQLAANGIPICVPCGYNLTGNESGVCPECGTKIESP